MPLTSKDRLVLIRIKVERAKKHLSEMEREARRLRDQKLYVVGMKENPKTGEVSLHHGPLPILPFDVVATAGDIIQNLRSALDHLAYHLAQVGLSGAEPHHDVSFPIGASAAIYESRKRRKVQGMRQEAIEAIDALKPYKGGNEPLWQLHELNNIDKHRLIFTLGHDHLFTGNGFNGGFWLKARNPVFTGILESEAYEETKFAIDKAIGETRVVKGQALLPTLHQLVVFVDNLISNFEPFLE